MTYDILSSKWDETHKKDECCGYIVSIFIHIIFFVIGGVVFVKTANYNIQSIPEPIQVDLVSAPMESKSVALKSLPKVKVHLEPLLKEDFFAPKVAPPKTIEAFKKPTPIQRPIQSVARSEAKPNYLQNSPPEYPMLAKEMRQQGLVLLKVDVDSYGAPIKVEVSQSSGFRLLDEAALRAVSHWKFEPGRIGNIPTSSTVIIPVRFSLVH